MKLHQKSLNQVIKIKSLLRFKQKTSFSIKLRHISKYPIQRCSKNVRYDHMSAYNTVYEDRDRCHRNIVAIEDSEGSGFLCFPVGASLAAWWPSFSHCSTYGNGLNWLGLGPFTLMKIKAHRDFTVRRFLLGVLFRFIHENPLSHSVKT